MDLAKNVGSGPLQAERRIREARCEIFTTPPNWSPPDDPFKALVILGPSSEKYYILTTNKMDLAKNGTLGFETLRKFRKYLAAAYFTEY